MGKEEQLTELVKDRIENLPKLRVGKYGQIQEWDQDYEEVEVGHRHISQLFAVSCTANPERPDSGAGTSSRKTLERRLENGEVIPDGVKAWIILFFARLWKKKKHIKIFKNYCQKSALSNLWIIHRFRLMKILEEPVDIGK